MKASEPSPNQFKNINQDSIETFGNLENSQSPRLKMIFDKSKLASEDNFTKAKKMIKKSPSIPLRNR